MRKLAPARVSHWDDFLISYRVYMMTGSFHILLFNGTFHVDKIHVWFKIANITHALPVPIYVQTDVTPKWVVVSRLHDTVARFRTGVNSRRGDSRRHNILWWYHVNKYRAMRGNRSEVAPVSCKHPLSINLLAFYHKCRSLIGYAGHYLFSLNVVLQQRFKWNWQKIN